MEEYERLREAFWKKPEHFDIQSPSQSKAVLPQKQIQSLIAPQAVPLPVVSAHTSSPRKRTLSDEQSSVNKRRRSIKQGITFQLVIKLMVLI